ncbi:sigma-70 family RNA polymerase sigma factor [bacterium]|nr:sigma-70 family RNA polymerase sigma factor [bacterium]
MATQHGTSASLVAIIATRNSNCRSNCLPALSCDMSLSDDQIMQRVLDGQPELFEELVRRHRPSLLRTAQHTLRNHALAEEAVQETFLAAYAKRTTFDPQFPFRGWLWTILLNNCRTIGRREQRRTDRTQLHSFDDEQLKSHADDEALASVLTAERDALLSQHLDRLPDVQADALRLRFFGGLTFEEIAAAMNCSLNGAKLRVKSGLERLAASIRHAHSGHQDAGDFP